MPRRGWRWFGAWTLAGGLVVFAFLGALSIGIFVLPFAILAVWYVQRVAGWGPEVVGGISGAGVVSLLVAFLNRDYRPCPDGPITIEPGRASFECGGFAPTPWWIAGLVLTLGGIAAYALLRRQGRRARAPRRPLTSGDKVVLGVVAVLGAAVLLMLGTAGWSGEDSGRERAVTVEGR